VLALKWLQRQISGTLSWSVSTKSSWETIEYVEWCDSLIGAEIHLLIQCYW
jgi:hypothetical protein